MNILQNTKLTASDNTYFVDLVELERNKHCVAISYTKSEDIGILKCHEIQLSPSVLSELIETLKRYKLLIDQRKNRDCFKVSVTDIEKIIQRYLKGVEIKDLQMQFDCSELTIKQILTNNGIEIVSNKIPGYYFRRYKKKRI